MYTKIFLIEKLWIDTLENHAIDAYGYKPIGFVFDEKEAKRICSFESIPKSKYPWPFDYAFEFKNSDTVPRFRFREFKDLTGSTLEDLKKIVLRC